MTDDQLTESLAKMIFALVHPGSVMTDDQLIESLRARTYQGDCEAAAFRIEELRARVAELEALPGNVLAQGKRQTNPRKQAMKTNGSKPESVNAELLEALKDARHCIGIDRDTLVDCHTNPCTGYLDPDGALAKAEYDDVIDAADAAITRAESAIETPAKVMHCTFFGLIPEGGMFFDPFSQHEFVKTSATTAVSSTEKDYIEDFHHNEMIVPIEDKGDERPE